MFFGQCIVETPLCPLQIRFTPCNSLWFLSRGFEAISHCLFSCPKLQSWASIQGKVCRVVLLKIEKEEADRPVGFEPMTLKMRAVLFRTDDQNWLHGSVLKVSVIFLRLPRCLKMFIFGETGTNRDRDRHRTFFSQLS